MKWIGLRIAMCLLVLGVIGCRQAPTSGSVTADAQPQVAVSSAPAAKKPPPPIAEEQSTIDTFATAGVRGTQAVKVVVLSDGKGVEGAHVDVLNAKGKAEGTGKTDDWGEYHLALSQGMYTVKVTAQGQTVKKSVKVDADTHEIDLKLDEPR